MSHNSALVANDISIVLATMGAYAAECALVKTVAPRFHLPTTKENNGWALHLEGGGAQINNRWYTEHALERMAPNTPEIRAILETRALERVSAKGYQFGTEEFSVWMRLNGPNPRGVPPMVVEAEIANPGSTGIRVVLNEKGNVITIEEINENRYDRIIVVF